MSTAACKRFLMPVLALALTGAAAAPPAPVEPAAQALVMRFAFLVGTQGPAGTPAATGVLAPRELQEYLQNWNFNSDKEEVRRVFALNHLTEVARQATELPAGGGKTQGVYTLESGQYEIHLSVAPLERDVRVEAELSKNGKLLSAPAILVRLGAQAVISSAETEGGRPTLFFVLEVERMIPKPSG